MNTGELNIYHKRVLDNVSEGILVIGFDGIISFANRTAAVTLGISEEELSGGRVSEIFFSNSENEKFAQAILDSVYDRENPHDTIVPYTSGDQSYILRLLTSFYCVDKERKGVIVVFSDLRELIELKDAVKSMQEIQKLNTALELRNKLLNETFGRFLSDEIVKKLIDTPDGLRLGGETRILTILMSDLRGFTAMCERLKPSELITVLNHYLGKMTDIIQSYGGTIIEFMGDGILAVFGAPEFFEDHASRAVAAALKMQSEMPEINIWNKEYNLPALEMGIGINTGEVVVGNLGSDRRMKYGIAGSEVNLCGRIESYSVGGQVLISPSTRAAVKEKLKTGKKMTVYPKGAGRELILTQVTGLGPPYNITLRLEGDKPVPLKKPAPVCFYLLEGKHNLKHALYGGITAAGDDRAVFETGTKLEILGNILIEAGGDLYCKVLEELKEGGYLIQFTAVPVGYAEWIKAFR
ncbi:MAG: PAS domain-containing protein [Lachnospiraceae bacterium]|nr:PAS domain-containing protein [Lachnospiraceae bacterium]